MTYHGSQWDSIANHIEHQVERLKIREDQKARGAVIHPRFKRKRIRDPVSYAKAVEDRKRLGLDVPKPKRLLARGIQLRSNRKITLAPVGKKPEEICERTEAETRAVERVEQAFNLIRYALSELGQIPNPHSQFKNRVSQVMMVQALRKLAYCTNPPLKMEPDPENHDPRIKMPLSKICIGCGGPARIEFQREWYCEFCAPAEADTQSRIREDSEERRERVREIKATERDANQLRSLIGKVERRIKHENKSCEGGHDPADDGGNQGEDA